MAEKKRRQYGTGGVTQRADGLWIGRIEAGVSATGTRRRLTVTAATKAECLRRLKEKQRQVAAEGLPVEGIGTTVTVKAWGESWLKIRTTDLRPQTRKGYITVVRRYITPAIGHRRLDSLTPADMRAVTLEVTDRQQLSPTTARLAHRVMMRMLRDALLEGHRVPDRVLRFRGPAPAVSDRDALELADALAILKQIGDDPSGTRWVAALLQGMRQGECLGLTWDCVDLDGGTIDISWQLQRIPHEHNCAPHGQEPTCGRRQGGRCTHGGKPIVPTGYEIRHLEKTAYLARPKSEKGQRIIPLVPWMIVALRQWKAIAPANPHGLVWATPKGAPITASADGDAWRAVQDAAGVSKGDGHYVIHEARHTTATLLLEAGVDPEVVKTILGQSKIITTRGYQHVRDTLTRAALTQLAGMLELTT